VAIFEHFKNNPEKFANFNHTMTKFSTNYVIFEDNSEAKSLFGSLNKIVDVGGGHGAFLSGILRANPNATGIVFDLPEVVAGGKARLDTDLQDLRDRLDFVEGSFFDSIPSGGDGYVAKGVLHDWSDEKAIEILKTIHKAMSKHAKLIIIDRVLSADKPDLLFMDIHMLVMCNGKERSAKLFEHLFAITGFKLVRIITLANAPASIVEAVKI